MDEGHGGISFSERPAGSPSCPSCFLEREFGEHRFVVVKFGPEPGCSEKTVRDTLEKGFMHPSSGRRFEFVAGKNIGEKPRAPAAGGASSEGGGSARLQEHGEKAFFVHVDGGGGGGGGGVPSVQHVLESIGNFPAEWSMGKRSARAELAFSETFPVCFLQEDSISWVKDVERNEL